ncbi:cytochrome-c peroxidase [Sulfurimonas sp. SWIR-19]|uniref:cytochrome-c peroxidase n=1 Tax=Sulfurimonas sp. SWIR-19 TaxID=2878390 RepID=UPI001CF5DE33|nr:cytochrome-c peroxidase [Sulfurimonas sp. SWIR-19]UCN00171.1 cytochrome-c peroxidase [Sulfurimonas sp. SWIR-19]
MYKAIITCLFFCTTLLMAKEPITPLPQSVQVNQAKAKLGQALFFDPILSHDNTISCASCHDLHNGGDDGLKFSFGIQGQEGAVNAPTVYNAVFNFRQFWDGRAKNLQEQAIGPILNPVEMGAAFEEIIPKLKKSKYKKLFDAVYDDGITKNTITDAIAEYEKTLITPNSRFDKYLRGDKNALTQNEKEGYELFKSKGCISCHHGENIGGNLYNKFGIFNESNSEWLGRYNITHKERDKYFFKVPSLRNIARTAPYFHDGRTYDLKKAVEIMSQYQLGRHITKEEISKITAFLQSLNGELPKNIEPQ